MNAEVAPLLPPERIATLEHQAFNNGYTAAHIEKLQKEGKNPDKMQNGAMITVTPREMAALILAYKEKQACVSPT